MSKKVQESITSWPISLKPSWNSNIQKLFSNLSLQGPTSWGKFGAKMGFGPHTNLMYFSPLRFHIPSSLWLIKLSVLAILKDRTAQTDRPCYTNSTHQNKEISAIIVGLLFSLKNQWGWKENNNSALLHVNGASHNDPLVGAIEVVIV